MTAVAPSSVFTIAAKQVPTFYFIGVTTGKSAMMRPDLEHVAVPVIAGAVLLAMTKLM